MKKVKNDAIDDKIKTSIQNEQTKEPKVPVPVVTEEEKQSLMDLLIGKAETFAVESKNKKRESEGEKIKFLLKGKEISLKEIRELIVANALPYSPIFYNETGFYKEIFRLMKWDDLDYNKYYKPRSVANLTNEIIYRRFSEDVLPSLQSLNGFLPNCWIRGYKNFQFLNEEGQRQVGVFRDEAIKIMKTCETMHEFRLKMNYFYNVPYSYQEPMF